MLTIISNAQKTRASHKLLLRHLFYHLKTLFSFSSSQWQMMNNVKKYTEPALRMMKQFRNQWDICRKWSYAGEMLSTSRANSMLKWCDARKRKQKPWSMSLICNNHTRYRHMCVTICKHINQVATLRNDFDFGCREKDKEDGDKKKTQFKPIIDNKHIMWCDIKIHLQWWQNYKRK